MALYQSIVRINNRATVAALFMLPAIFVVSGCASWPFQQREVNYHNPPSVQSFLQPRYGRVHCKERSAATAMALTGFFAVGCVRLKQADRWRVVSVSFSDLGNGQTLWLAEVRDLESDDQVIRWAPIPWHDWA